MTNGLEQCVLDNVRNTIGSERFGKVIVYLDDSLRRAGERLPVGDLVIDMPWDGHVAFIDLEPRLNWGHACLYLAIRLGGGNTRCFPAQMPPFLKADGSPFRPLWRGPSAPGWAVATNHE
jgi:hypothetical protein